MTLYNRVAASTGTTGTGSITLGDAISGYRAFTVIPDGTTIPYTINDGSAWEVGEGVYTAGVLTRAPDESSNNDELLSLTGRATVFVVLRAQDANGFAPPLGYTPVNKAGDTGVGALTFTGLITTNGQVAFPATQVPSADANTLDDYEEGTFTPAVAFGGASVGVTYAARSGRYTKVGRMVVVEIKVSLSSKGSSTGVVTVTALPFACGADGNAAATISPMASSAQAVGYVAPAATIVQLFSGATALADTNISNTSYISLSLAYSV
jgi:hypothetical protein